MTDFEKVEEGWTNILQVIKKNTTDRVVPEKDQWAEYMVEIARNIVANYDNSVKRGFPFNRTFNTDEDGNQKSTITGIRN